MLKNPDSNLKLNIKITALKQQIEKEQLNIAIFKIAKKNCADNY